MSLDAVEKTTAELMGYLAYEGLKQGIEVDDLMNRLVEFLNSYDERRAEK